MSLHQKVWSKISKSKHCGLKQAEYAAAQTVVEHNLGYEYAAGHGKLNFGIDRPSTSTQSTQARDKSRTRHSVTPKPKKKKYANIPPPDEDYGAGEH